MSMLAHSSQRLDLLLFLLPALGLRLLALRKVPPAADPLLPCLLPRIIVFALPLPFSSFLVLFLLLAALLAHLRFHLALLAHLVVTNHPDSFLAPFLPELLGAGFFVVGGEFLFAHKQHAGVGNVFVEFGAEFLVEEHGLRFLEPVEGIGRERVFGLVRMDEEGLGAVDFLDVGLGDTWLEAEDCVGVEAEDVADSWGGEYFVLLVECA